MFIQTEETPNPATLKFLPGQAVLPGATAEFKSEEDAEASPLARRILALSGVKSIFLGGDFVSVTKAEDADWDLLKTHILGELMQHFVSGLPVMEAGWEKASVADEDYGDDNEIVAQIKELLDTRIRPAVAADGGDILFDRFVDGVVYLHMRGACAGCPSSTMTLKSGIENMLRHYVPEVQAVEAAADYGF